MILSHIVAIGQNQEIGRQGDLIWHIPEDLKNFKRITTGHHILMGRKTYESIGRPLPKRTSLVVTRIVDKIHQESEQLIYFPSIDQAIEWSTQQKQEELFIIGGDMIYQQTANRVERIYLTKIHASDSSADRFYPKINTTNWTYSSQQDFPEAAGKHPAWTFSILEKKT